MSVGAMPAPRGGHGGDGDVGHARIAEQPRELVGLEAQPQVGLVGAQGLVFVPGVVEHDHHRAGAAEPHELPHHLRGLRRVVQHPGGQHEVGPFFGATPYGLTHRRVVEGALHEVDVAEAPLGHPLGRRRELRTRPVDRHHVRKQRREHLQEPPVAGARVHREGPLRHEAAQREEVRRELRRRPRLGPGATRPREKLPRPTVARAHHLGHTPEAAVALTQAAPRRQRVAQHRVARSPLGQPHERPVALAPYRHHPRLPQRPEVPRHIGLRLAQQLGQLAHRELLLRRERHQPQTRRLAQATVQLPARTRAGPIAAALAHRHHHGMCIYHHAYDCK
jgi:hypothetical protein